MTDFKSLLKRYEVIPNIDRPLTEQEAQSQLHQRQKVEIEPHDVASVIRLNSSFLEITDIHYGWRGVLVTGGAIGNPILMFMLYTLVDDTFNKFGGFSSPGVTFGFLTTFLLGIGALAIGLAMFFYESFRFTHFPIRFNRKNRMVYVFRRNGTVLTVPWDEVFFWLREPRSEGNDYVIEGHVLDIDRSTVMETFSLGYKSSEATNMYAFWEYIRSYMEHGPQDLFEGTDFCLPIWDRRESPIFGFWKLLLKLNGLPFFQLILSPFFLLFSLGRVIAIWTSRIPTWPKDVENACAIEPNDPYARDWRMNTRRYLFFFGRKKSKA